MRITETRVFRGPNLYAHFPVIRLTLELGDLEARPSATIEGFPGRLLDCLPSLAEHGCSYGEPGGFVRRLTEDEGTWFGHILEHVAIELQQLAGAKVTFGKTRGTRTEGEYHVIYAYEEERVEGCRYVGTRPLTPPHSHELAGEVKNAKILTLR